MSKRTQNKWGIRIGRASDLQSDREGALPSFSTKNKKGKNMAELEDLKEKLASKKQSKWIIGGVVLFILVAVVLALAA